MLQNSISPVEKKLLIKKNLIVNLNYLNVKNMNMGQTEIANINQLNDTFPTSVTSTSISH